MVADSAIAVAIPLIKHEKHRRVGRTTATGRGRSLANQPESGTLSKTRGPERSETETVVASLLLPHFAIRKIVSVRGSLPCLLLAILEAQNAN